ncbi:MAG: LysR family transcriptional regulator [Firmicutes bacterium]|nr:LysR family transcriptional regulator [Bacillota bacterium]
MDFNQLRYFTSLAVLGNMSKAAEVLNISQSTLSKSIARLEQEIGCELFDRNGRRITLNPSGKVFFEESVRILEMMDSAVEKSRRINDDFSSRIKICVTGASKAIIKCISEYEKTHPSVCFDIDSFLDVDEVPRINNYDLMICPDSPRYSIYPGTKINSDRMALCISKKHPYASKIAVNVKDLNGLDVVYLKKNGVVESVQTGLEVLSVKTGKTFYVSTRDLHRQMISEGIGVGYILTGAASFYASDDNIAILPIMDDRFVVQMKVVFRKDKHLSEEAKAFREFALDYLTK